MAALTMAAGTSGAQEAYQANAGAKAGAALQSPPGIAALALADRALAYARQTGTADAYLSAAELYRAAGFARSTPGEPATIDPAPAGFWQEAERAVAGNDWAEQMLRRIREREFKNLDGAPMLFDLQVGAENARVLRYRGGEVAMIYLRGGPAAVRLAVFDQNGAVVCRADAREGPARCRWTPRWTGAFRVQLDGPPAARVQVATN